MKIKEVTREHILFDNDSEITFNHNSWSSIFDTDCPEYNYADFEQLEESALKVDFNTELIFENVDRCGFRFGSERTPMFSIPCYSVQDGHRSSDVDIYYNGTKVLNVGCAKIIVV